MKLEKRKTEIVDTPKISVILKLADSLKTVTERDGILSCKEA
ncbi:MAG: hypothetical protein UIK35_08710 [Coprococcus catus]|nr:hypothetical protein [Coprococcus catus]